MQSRVHTRFNSKYTLILLKQHLNSKRLKLYTVYSNTLIINKFRQNFRRNKVHQQEHQMSVDILVLKRFKSIVNMQL